MEELVRLFNAAKKRDKEPERQCMLYYLLVSTGIRINELLKAEVYQFDVTRGRYECVARNTKSRKDNTLVLRDDVVVALRKYIKRQKLKLHNNLFGDFNDNLRVKYYDRLFTDLKSADIPRCDERKRVVDFHSFRVTFGTFMARAGVPLTTIQNLLTHSTPVLTANPYTDKTEQDKREAVNKIDIPKLDDLFR
jgi:integrase/recombinase XerC